VHTKGRGREGEREREKEKGVTEKREKGGKKKGKSITPQYNIYGYILYGKSVIYV